MSICHSRILLLLLEPALSILHHAKVTTNRLHVDCLGFDFGHLNKLYMEISSIIIEGKLTKRTEDVLKQSIVFYAIYNVKMVC